MIKSGKKLFKFLTALKTNDNSYWSSTATNIPSSFYLILQLITTFNVYGPEIEVKNAIKFYRQLPKKILKTNCISFNYDR